MIANRDKIMLINSLIAGMSPASNELYANATSGIMSAIKDGVNISLEDFSKRVVSIYNPLAKLEFLDFSGGYFDPLFAIPTISSAMRRLSGYSSAILIINGLSEIPKGKRMTSKARRQKAEDFEFAEDFVAGYKKSFPKIEVFFI